MECTTLSVQKANSDQIELPLAQLKDVFAMVPDPRCQNGQLDYPLWLMLLAVTAGLLAGQTSLLACAEWLAVQDLSFKQKLGFKAAATPVQSTFQRLFARLSATALQAALTTHFAKLAAVASEPTSEVKRASQAIAIDGKCQKGRNKFSEKFQPVHLISLFCQQLGVVLAQSEVAPEHNEISSAPQLLQQIEWQGRVLTGDAAYCQRNLCEQVVAAGGDYLLVVKGNQKQLYGDISDLFNPTLLTEVSMEIQTSRNLSKGHGRVEIRTIQTSSELLGISDWPHLAQVLMLKREWSYKGEWKEDVRYGVTSLRDSAVTIEKLASYKRGHWSIENKLHWVRDVVFGEDASLTHEGNGPVVMASLCNTALNIMRLAGINKITAQLRRNVAQPQRILELLGLG